MAISGALQVGSISLAHTGTIKPQNTNSKKHHVCSVYSRSYFLLCEGRCLGFKLYHLLQSDRSQAILRAWSSVCHIKNSSCPCHKQNLTVFNWHILKPWMFHDISGLQCISFLPRSAVKQHAICCSDFNKNALKQISAMITGGPPGGNPWTPLLRHQCHQVPLITTPNSCIFL